MIRVKNHQIPPTILVDAAFGFKPDPYFQNELKFDDDRKNIDLFS